ncbi:MAG: hypothetical protein ACI835_002945 [Planctomycetota bacterium]|jgi:hypothetical protein
MLWFATFLPALLSAPLQEAPPAWGQRIQWAEESGPPAREHASFMLDEKRDRAIMFAGSGYSPYGSPLEDAWAFDLELQIWSNLDVVGDAFTAGGARRVARVEGSAYLHGGYDGGMQPIGELWRMTFTREAVRIESVAQINPPPPRMLHAFACDPKGERFIVFGGGTIEEEWGNTWIGQREGEAIAWTMLETIEPNPGMRAGFAFAHDISTAKLLVCGGQIPNDDDPQAVAFASDLWSIDFLGPDPAWTLLAEYEPKQFPGRRNPAFVLDQRTGDMHIWGGTGNGVSALDDLYIVRTREDEAPVERLAQPPAIPTRASCFGVVDASRERALLGFGNTGQGAFDDLVEIRLRGTEQAKNAGAKAAPKR